MWWMSMPAKIISKNSPLETKMMLIIKMSAKRAQFFHLVIQLQSYHRLDSKNRTTRKKTFIGIFFTQT